VRKVKICGITTETTAMKYFFLEQMELLNSNNFDVTIACDMDVAFFETNSHKFKCIPISMARGVDVLGLMRAVVVLYKDFKLNKYDIVQYTTPNASLYASIAGFLAGIPIRYYCQWGVRYVGFSGIPRLLFKILEKITCKFSTHITLDSPGNLDFCVKEGVFERNKGSVIYNGSVNGIDFGVYDLTKKSIWRERIRNLYNIGPGDFVVGYMGRLMRDKGTNELLAACKLFLQKYTGVYFLIVGPVHSYRGLDAQLLKWAENEDRIIFTGSRDNPHEYLAAFDMFVFPSYREGYGGGVIQAGAFEIPSVVSDIPPLLDSIDHGKYGLSVSVKNKNSLFLGIEKMYLDNEMRNKMGKAFRRWLIDNFERSKWLTHYLNYVTHLTNDCG